MPKVKDIDVEFAYGPDAQIADFLEQNEGHFNDEPNYEYIIPSGSLTLDIAMNGGLRPGIARFVGISEGGKSSCVHEFVKNFLTIHDNARALIIPSEGKRFETLMARRDEIPFTLKPKEWKNKMAFVYRTNVYEKAVTAIYNLVENNPTNTRYIFVIDSIDALIPEGDLPRAAGEATKVAGGAVLASDFLKKTSLMITTRGHLILLISQVRAEIQINQYVKTEDKITSARGGNALIHYADWILKFQGHASQVDRIWAGDKGKSTIIGHFAEILFEKTPVEKTGKIIKYPIKYEPKGGKIWTGYEVADNLLMYNLAKNAGAWVTLNEHILNDFKDHGFDVPAKHNGIDKFRKYFDDNPDITNYLLKKLRQDLIE